MDVLRPPWPLEPDADGYKDWLHLNVFDHRSGSVGLFNASLHGSPMDPGSRAIGTALLHVPDWGWTGNVEVRGMDEAGIGATSISLEGVAIAADHPSGEVHVSVRLPRDRFRMSVRAERRSPSFAVQHKIPFGDGWISWYVLPRLSVQGAVRAGDHTLDLRGATAYHDHNWGRWHWGDDVGWEWGAFAGADDGPMFVFTRATDRAHARLGEAVLVADLAGTRRTFRGPSVTLGRGGRLDAKLRRLPGALAALHGDRASPPLPATVSIAGGDGIDHVEIEFEATSAGQLIAGDPVWPGYGFIHEVVGRFRARGRIAGRPLEVAGPGVFEHVD